MPQVGKTFFSAYRHDIWRGEQDVLRVHAHEQGVVVAMAEAIVSGFGGAMPVASKCLLDAFDEALLSALEGTDVELSEAAEDAYSIARQTLAKQFRSLPNDDPDFIPGTASLIVATVSSGRAELLHIGEEGAALVRGERVIKRLRTHTVWERLRDQGASIAHGAGTSGTTRGIYPIEARPTLPPDEAVFRLEEGDRLWLLSGALIGTHGDALVQADWPSAEWLAEQAREVRGWGHLAGVRIDC